MVCFSNVWSIFFEDKGLHKALASQKTFLAKKSQALMTLSAVGTRGRKLAPCQDVHYS